MASLEFDNPSGKYRIRFRYGGKPFKRSVKTSDRTEAEGVAARVEETIRLLERGRLDLPPGADPGVFILSDGKLNSKASAGDGRTLDELLKLYKKSLPKDAKAQTTLNTEDTHVSHLLRHLGKTKLAQCVTTAHMQGYTDKRLRDSYRDKPMRPDTVRKEVATFRLIWNWAVSRGYLTGPAPTRGLKYPKTEQKSPFMTREEIEKIIKRGGLSEEQNARLWDCIFLTGAQVKEILEYVKSVAEHPFIYPMFVFVAHTGARRSEILRAQVDDFDFQSRTVLIREKKRSHDKSLTYRRVRMSDLLVTTMQDWFAKHPGGQFAICEPVKIMRGKTREVGVPLSRSEAHDHFKRTLANSKWSKIRGFHAFRHSFASNLAAAGVDQGIIDEWMGHQTEEMRKRYRHLFPEQQQKVIDSVFGKNGKSQGRKLH
jgi:integrase